MMVMVWQTNEYLLSTEYTESPDSSVVTALDSQSDTPIEAEGSTPSANYEAAKSSGFARGWFE